MADERAPARHRRQYEEIEEYRDLLQAPGRFESGFTRKTLVGVLFIALVMTPGQIYLSLVTGLGIGDAAQWVTVILFLEIAKRSFTTLRRQEIFLLSYVASQLLVRAETGTFLQLIWRQYFVGSPEAAQFGLRHKLIGLQFMGHPWFAPPPDSPAILERTFVHPDWLLPIALLVMGIVVGRITWFTSGYALFRLVSDREQLPFPTAPQAALGSMALAEESGSEERSWKWPCFTIGGAVGLVFGFIYVGVPNLTEIFAGVKVTILPIPFVDLTPQLGRFLGATPIAISLSLAPIFVGLLAPFWGIMGSFAGVLVFVSASPLLHYWGLMPRWVPGMSAIQTQITGGVDFWQAFGLGVTLAVVIISLIQVVRAGGEQRRDRRAATGKAPLCLHAQCRRRARVRGYCIEHLGRGDFNLWICIALFFLAAAYPIFMARTLFPLLVSSGLLLFMLCIAFVYAPLMSFVSARLDGLIGQNIQIPHLHEATVFLTGYRGVEIWFVPLAGQDFGGNAETFRIIELTGMRFTSLLKAELVMVPVVLGASLIYWSFLWKLAPIPSEAYPYVQIFWPKRAFDEAVRLSATQYSRMWRQGEEVEGKPVPSGQVVWSPANLQDQTLYYWRARITDQGKVPDPAKRRYGPWSQTRYFYTDFSGAGLEKAPAAEGVSKAGASGVSSLPAPQLLGPEEGVVVQSPTPYLRAGAPGWGGEAEFFFEVDSDPEFRGDLLQRSTEVPLFFQIFWRDLKYTGDGRDEDLDGAADEEVFNQRDDDGDGEIDEDGHHPLRGRKWLLIAAGAGVGLGLYALLGFCGAPLFFFWGFNRALVSSGAAAFFGMFTEVIGALLARYYFWPRYGRQQWRQYAMVLSVGYGVGMALIGMFSVGLRMIARAVSAASF